MATMKSAKKMYEDMLTEPAKPSLSHTTKSMDMASKMFSAEPKKMAAGGYVKAADGCITKGHTRGRMV